MKPTKGRWNLSISQGADSSGFLNDETSDEGIMVMSEMNVLGRDIADAISRRETPDY